MPNHVRNILTIVGPARDIATFVMRSRQPRPRTGDQPVYHAGRQVNPNYQDPPREAPYFDFHGVVPLPPAYSTHTYNDVGYDLERNTWGQKWGPYNVNPATDIVIDEHMASYSFTTAWGPPRQYYNEASRAFPLCTFAISYGGEGPCFGRMLYQDGQCLCKEEGDHTTLPVCENDEGWDAYEMAVNHYLLSHTDWVTMLVAAQEDIPYATP